MNKSWPNPIDEARLTTLFDSLWAQLDEKVSKIPPSQSKEKVQRSQSEILEDVFNSLRGVEIRIKEATTEVRDRAQRAPRKYKRFHPGMVFDFADMASERSKDPVFLLIISAYFREDFPWASELISELYRAIVSGSAKQTQAAMRRLKSLVALIDTGHPLIFELSGEGRDDLSMLRDLPFVLDRFIQQRPSLDRLSQPNVKRP